MGDSVTKLDIESTFTTPEVHFDPENYKFHIKGNSYPENSVKFYQPIVTLIENFVNNHPIDPQRTFEVIVELEYFNTSTAKALLDLFRLFETLYQRGQPVQIKWLYMEEDTEMEDAGLDYQAAIKLPFELVTIHEET